MTISTIMQWRNLEALLRVAKAMPVETLDMDYWGHVYTINPPQGHWSAVEVEAPCGTHACLLGNAAQDPYFKAQGLRMRWNISEQRTPNLGLYEWQAELTLKGENCLVTQREWLFGLNPSDEPRHCIWDEHEREWISEDDYLFMPHSYKEDGQQLEDAAMKAEVIRHIEVVMKRFRQRHAVVEFIAEPAQIAAAEPAEPKVNEPAMLEFA